MTGCAIISGILSFLSEAAFYMLLGVSLCSLFLFAVVFLFLMPKLREIPAQIACMGLWFVLGVIQGGGQSSHLGQLLMKLPSVALFATTTLLIALFVLQIRAQIIRKGENNYAVG